MFRNCASSVSAEYDSPFAVIKERIVHSVAKEEETASKSRKTEIILIIFNCNGRASPCRQGKGKIPQMTSSNP